MSINKFKLLIVIPGSDIPSSMIFSKRQAESLDKSLFEVKTFFLSSRTSFTKLFSERKRFKSLLKSFRPDILHSHYGTMTSFFCAVNSNIPLVITFHGSDINKTPSDGYFRDTIGRFLSRLSSLKAKKIICVSSKLSDQLWFVKRKTVVIPVGVDIDKFFPLDKIEARIKLNWDLHKKIVIFNANNPKIKRLDIALQVFELLKKEIPNVYLEILSGNLNPDLVPFYLNASDCLLLCSNSEGSPSIIKEALSCNLPVVTNDVGDVKERLNGVSSVIITDQNPVMLAKSISQILKGPERTNGREKIIDDNLSESQVAERITKVYLEILKTANKIIDDNSAVGNT